MIRMILIATVMFTASCSSGDEPIDTTIPSCIESIIANPVLSEGLKTIQVQRLNNRNHYWLNDDVRFVDGIEYVVSNQCDTVCGLGGFFPPGCASDYDAEGWEVIWSQ